MARNAARKKLPVVLTATEADALRAQCTRSATGLRNRAMIEIMLGAGLRVSEVIALRPVDIDWTAGTVRVNDGKGGRDRVVPINADTRAHLQAWTSKRTELGYNGRHPFFLGLRTKGRALTAQNIQQTLRLMAEAAGIEKRVSPHVLRHTYATGMLDGGYTIREVQELLGHSDVSTTMIYTHVSPEALRRKIQGDDEGDRADLAELAKQIAGLGPDDVAALAALLQQAQ